MKKYSAEYFDKKFRILFDKLKIKEGFIEEVKKIRKELEVPVENGFADSLEFASYLIKKLTPEELEEAIFVAHIKKHEHEKETRFTDLTERDQNAFIKHFMKERKKTDSLILAVFDFQMIIEDHVNLFTSNHFLNRNKFYSKLSPIVFEILNKFWGFDLLDELTIVHFIENYLFLGESGVKHYIKSRLACPSCMYIGIHHFSPNRNNMQGQKEGAFGKNYIFNKDTVKLLSSHFNSVFLIIKPYATKEQVIQYVEDNWHSLKEHVIEKNQFYKQDDVNPSKIKESDFDKNQLVYNLYKLPKKELTKQYQELEKELPLPHYKESIISTILKNKYNIVMSSDAVKKSATRFAKSIKIQKEPKDIRDI